VLHVGCVIVPITGAFGVAGCALMTVLDDVPEVQDPSFTVNAYVVLAVKLFIVFVEPVPVTEFEPYVKVHAPEGKPLKTTDPVAVLHVGCVIVPIIGAEGANGCALMTVLDDVPEVQDPSFTVNVYVVLAVKLLIVVVAPVPVIEVEPYVKVHAPEGKPLKTTDPVAVLHVGCVIVPIIGAAGVTG
jgi:hypothetical protein